MTDQPPRSDRAISHDERHSALEGLSADDVQEMVLRLAHEIRNPLATIKSGVQLALRLGTPDARMHRYLQGAITEVDRIDRTIRGLQRVVKVAPLPARAVDLRAELSRYAQPGSDTGDGPTVAVRAVLGRTAQALIHPEHLSIALRELLSNAVRFSPAGGEVTLSWEVADEGMVAIHVDDDGPGVDDAVGDRILRPFFSTSTQGTGLGLTLVSRICRMAGGRLQWRNLVGHGCRFSLVLRRT